MSSGKTKIPDDLAQIALEMSGQTHHLTQRRWTSAQLSDWLRDSHGITVDPRTVSNLLRTLRAEALAPAQDAARAVLLERLAPQLTKLDDLIEKMANDAATTEKITDRVAMVEMVRRTVETKLRFSGVGEKVEHGGEVNINATHDVTDARRALATALAGEDEGADAGAAGARTGEPT